MKRVRLAYYDAWTVLKNARMYLAETAKSAARTGS
jgi:hypothetical protein